MPSVVEHEQALGLREIEDTYARWLKRTDDRLRVAFDAYDAAASVG